MNCRICKSGNLTKFLSLGHMPPSDAFLTEEDLNKPEVTYPLDLWACEECSLVQLGYVVPKEVLYNGNYPYTTGSNKDGVKHFRQMAKDVVEQYGKGFVVDIGGNDGTLLKGFQELGCGVLNVEPSPDIAVKACVPTIASFWDKRLAKDLKEDFGKADIICATNVFAHIDDLHDFMRGIDILLADDGVFVVEAPSWSMLIENLAYDTIYHEHLSYFDPVSMQKLVAQYNMNSVNISHARIHGGSCRYVIKRV